MRAEGEVLTVKLREGEDEFENMEELGTKLEKLLLNVNTCP